MMSVRPAVLVFAGIIALQLQVADARPADDVSHVIRTASPDVIRVLSTAIQPRDRHPTSFQQQKQSRTRSKSVSDSGQAQSKSSTLPTSFARYDRPLFNSERPKVSVNRSSSSSSKTKKAGSRIHSDNEITATEFTQFTVSNAPVTASSQPDAEVLNAKSTSALVLPFTYNFFNY